MTPTEVLAAVDTPHIVLVSGSLRADSTSDRVARWCARRCVEQGAGAHVFPGAELQFPFYRPGLSGLSGQRGHSGAFVRALGRADGLVLVSPTYHGTVSGLLKNALDYANDLVAPRMFLEGVPVGCVAVGAGAQGMASTLTTLRTIGHALRAWPTPLGVTARDWAEEEADGEEKTGGAQEAGGEEEGAAQRQARAQMAVMLSQVLSMASANAPAAARQHPAAHRG